MIYVPLPPRTRPAGPPAGRSPTGSRPPTSPSDCRSPQGGVGSKSLILQSISSLYQRALSVDGQECRIMRYGKEVVKNCDDKYLISPCLDPVNLCQDLSVPRSHRYCMFCTSADEPNPVGLKGLCPLQVAVWPRNPGLSPDRGVQH